MGEISYKFENFLEKLNIKQILLLNIFIFLCCFILYYFFILKNYFVKINNYSQKEIFLSDEVIKILNASNKKKQNEKVIKEIEEYYGILKKEELKDKIYSFMQKTDGILKSCTVENLGMLSTKEFENAIEFFLKVDFIGKWENIIKFIYDIENSEEPVSIVELRMQNQIKFEDDIKGSLLLSRYYIKDKK